MRRARAKARTDVVVAGLVKIGAGTPLRRAYANTMKCEATIGRSHELGAVATPGGTVIDFPQDGIESWACGNRWCDVCGRIRTAKQGAAYGPIVAGWTGLQHMTLTVPNVRGPKLIATVDEMIKQARTIANDVRRTDRLPWLALRKLEVTYNRTRGDYHPHFHFLVAGEASARAFMRRWVRAWPGARRVAQNIRAVESDAGLRELLNYVAKAVTRDENKQLRGIPAFALDLIYRAVRRRRTVQPMGFRMPAKVDAVQSSDLWLREDGSLPAPVPNASRPLHDETRARSRWHWNGPARDWVHPDTGECLVGWEPSPKWAAAVARIAADVMGEGEGPRNVPYALSGDRQSDEWVAYWRERENWLWGVGSDAPAPRAREAGEEMPRAPGGWRGHLAHHSGAG